MTDITNMKYRYYIMVDAKIIHDFKTPVKLSKHHMNLRCLEFAEEHGISHKGVECISANWEGDYS